jgi:hypothetical protein
LLPSLTLAQVSPLQPNQFMARPPSGTGYLSPRQLAASDLPFNMIHYGADPTGVSDSCGTPLTNALADIPVGGGTIYWPKGTYLCGGQIAIANKSIIISGDAPGISNLRFSSGLTNNAGISISQNSATYTTGIKDLSIITTAAQSANAGVLINYTVRPNVNRTVTVRNIDINGGPSNLNYWHIGLNCVNCGFGVINNFHIKGKNEGNPATGMSVSNMLSGIHLTARSTDLRIEDGSVVFSTYGVYISGDSESQQFTDTTMLAVNYGWLADDFTGGADSTALASAPGPRIINSHCAAYSACVYIKGWTQSIIANNLFYKRPESILNFNHVLLANGTYRGSHTVGSTNNSIIGNTFIGFAAGGSTTTGINFDTLASNNAVRNNTSLSLNNLATFNGGAQVNIVSDNSSYPGGLIGTWFASPSSKTIAFNNLPVNAGSDTGTETLTANSTTPNVGGSVVSSFLTSNTSATTITNFVNGYVGQVITIVANDANTTVQHNAGMLLHLGVDYVMSVGNTLTLKREQNTYWREIGRS